VGGTGWDHTDFKLGPSQDGDLTYEMCPGLTQRKEGTRNQVPLQIQWTLSKKEPLPTQGDCLSFSLQQLLA
jgi:hypothetical protein